VSFASNDKRAAAGNIDVGLSSSVTTVAITRMVYFPAAGRDREGAVVGGTRRL